MADSQAPAMTDEHNEWIRQFCGTDPTTAAAPADQEQAPPDQPAPDQAAAQPAAADPALLAAAPGSAAPEGGDGSGTPEDASGGTDEPPPSSDDPNAGGGGQAPGPRMIGVTIITSYGQQVRYWIQDLAIDANNEVALGAGRTLVDGDAHGPNEAIGLTCIETANGAAVGYRRESYPYPPGGGETSWTHVLISEGSTATMIL